VSRRLRVILVVLGATVLVVVAAAVVWRVALRDTATPASIDDALARYREDAARGDTPIPPGVYVYATSGSESVSALGGTTHTYPGRSTITVTAAPCGMALRWDVLETRSSIWDVCGDGDGDVVQRLDGWMEAHEFFGQDDRTTWRCSSSPWLVGPVVAGTTFPHSCDGGDTTQSGTVTVVGEESIDVGGVSVETLRLRLEAEEEGAARGSLVEERWVERETGLPVRVDYRVQTDNDSLIGDVVFEEAYAIELLSLEPRT